MATKKKRPNILFIMPDQQRADMMGSYGDPAAKTPVTDDLAASGLQFEHCYCQAPLCMPSRASLLSERYPRDHGVYQNQSVLNTTVPTFAKSIRDAGYHTVQTGKTHFTMHLPWNSDEHMDDYHPTLKAYGFDECYETAGKEAVLQVNCVYTDYLKERGLLDEMREFLGQRTPLARELNPNLKPKFAWQADPLPLPNDAHQDAWLGDFTADWIRGYDFEKPFFLQVGFPGPHDPWDASEEALEEFGDPEIPMPGTMKLPEIPEDGPGEIYLRNMVEFCNADTLTPEAVKKMRRAYYANMMVIDQSIGKIIDALKERGEYDNTWIIYTSDHGEMMGEHSMVKKMVFFEPSVQVPLIVRPPGGVSAERVKDLVELNDIAATMRAIAGADEMVGSHAVSLLPAFEQKQVGRDVVISEAYGFVMFRTEAHKLVVYEDDQIPIQLFDLKVDPLEENNLVNDPEHMDVLFDLMDKYTKPFLAIKPLRPHRSMVEVGSLQRNPFYMPEEIWAE